jgi:RNA polymerase sigma-70 factor (ECF subfamily)
VETPTLFARARSGDPAAREALLERRLEQLRVWVEFRLGPALRRHVEPEDVVQETVLRAWRDLDGARLEDERGFAHWLFAIARHVLADVARAARAARRDGGSLRLERSSWSRSGSLDPADPGPGPRTRALGGEARERLLAGFQKLSPRHRRVIALRHLEGRSAREAAPLLGCSEEAVHALFRRALDALGRALDGPGGEPRSV